MDRNKEKIKKRKVQRIGVNGAMHVIWQNKMREKYDRKREEERARQKKREEIVKQYPWIGEALQYRD